MNDQAAFPVVVPADWDSVQNGMSLRDWFAGQALAGITSNHAIKLTVTVEERAEWSYQMADAMMAERD
jgi:hypothetical protein